MPSIRNLVPRAALVLVAALIVAAAACSGGEEEQKGLVIGRSSSTTTAAPAPTIPPDPSTTTAAPATAPPTAAAAPIVLPPQGFPDGAPYSAAMAFSSAVPVPQDLVFLLAIGSDARPGGNPRKSNADSLHLLAVDPATGSGTVLGFPRDSWVQVPGRGTRKINSALAMGGPELQAETIRLLTGLPVHYWVLTAFEGFERLVDDLGGVHVNVDRKMNDRFSGAKFEPGWHHMTGREALAYSRNRKDTQNGDFDRSLHQGNVILSALAKMRAEVGDDAGVAHWINILLRHADLDSPPQQLTELATLARNLDPARITNIVVPGRVGNASGQSVVFLGDEARNIFLDLRPDAVLGGASGDRPAAAAAVPPPAPDPAPAPEAAPPAEAPAATEPESSTTTGPAADLPLSPPNS